MSQGQVVINEFQYDDTGPDDREFVELYNAGSSPVSIGGWVLGGYDPTSTNASVTVTAGTSLAAGDYYVIGNAGVLNLDQTAASGFLENENEIITLRDSTGALIDAVAYETNRGTAFFTGSTSPPADAAAVSLELGPGLFGNSQGIDIAGTPLNSTVALGRFVDGRDTNNNGRDFGLRPATLGTANNPGGLFTAFAPADPAPLAPGTSMTGMMGSFVPPRVVDPAVVDTNNLNAISSPYGAGSKAYVMWDPSGGGNGATSTAVFATSEASFKIRAYLDTTDLPVQFNSTNVQFRGSEVTLYGLGGGDALTNLTDLDGSVGLVAITLPAAETANGFTGVAWIYERVAADPAASTVAYSEKLYLVDANDGGDSDLGGNTPLDWTILATYNLNATPAGWYDLSISVDAAGNGTASFNGQVTAFTTIGLNSGAFNVGYRENLQMGTDGTPDAFIRPATFTFAPATGLAGDIAFAAESPGARNLTIPTNPGQTVGIEYSTDLTTGSWLDIGSFTVTGSTGNFSDTNAGRLANPRGFYRAVPR